MNLHEKIREAENLFNQGQVDAAKTILAQLLDYAPENATILNNLGVIAYQEGQLEQALSYFMQALESNPADEDSFVNAVAILTEHQQISGLLQACLRYAQSVRSESDMTPVFEKTLIWLTEKIAEEKLICISSKQPFRHVDVEESRILQSILNDFDQFAGQDLHQFLTALALLYLQREGEECQSVFEHLEFQSRVLNTCTKLLQAILFLKQNNKTAAREIAKTIQGAQPFQSLVDILLQRSKDPRNHTNHPARKALVIIDHRGILKLFVNMLICAPDILKRYEFQFVVSEFYKGAELFGPVQELKTLEDLEFFHVNYDLWAFLKFIDNGSIEHSVVYDRQELLHRYPELMQEAAHEFCLRYNPEDYDIIITGLRSQTLIPMLRFIGYSKSIILYPVAPFLYYPGFRSFDNEFIIANKDVYSDGCFHVVAGDFYEDMYHATFPDHPFKVIKIPHGVNTDFYGKWQGDRETIFWANGGITNSGSPLNMIMQYLLKKHYPLDVFGYLCYEKTNSNCNPSGAPESLLRESMIHSQLAIQYFVSHQMIGFVEKLAVGIPTIGLIPPQHLAPASHLTRQYRAEIDFIDREAAIPLKQGTDVAKLLETKINALLASKEKREQTSAYLRDVCQKRYNFDRYMKQWRELLELASENSGETRKSQRVASLLANV